MFDDMSDDGLEAGERLYKDYLETESGFFDGKVPDALKDFGELGEEEELEDEDEAFLADGESFVAEQERDEQQDLFQHGSIHSARDEVKGAKDFHHYGPSKKEHAYGKVEAQWDNEMHKEKPATTQHTHPVAHPGPDLLEFPMQMPPLQQPRMPREPEDWKRPSTNTNSINANDSPLPKQQPTTKPDIWDPHLASSWGQKQQVPQQPRQPSIPQYEPQPGQREALAPSVKMLFEGMSTPPQQAVSPSPQKKVIPGFISVSQLEASIAGSTNAPADLDAPPGFGEPAGMSRQQGSPMNANRYQPSQPSQQRSAPLHHNNAQHSPLHGPMYGPQQGQQMYQQHQQGRQQQPTRHEHQGQGHQHPGQPSPPQGQHQQGQSRLQQLRSLVLQKLPQQKLYELSMMPPDDQLKVIDRLVAILEPQLQEQQGLSEKMLHREQEPKEKSDQILNKPKTYNTYNPNPFRAKWKKEKTYMTAAEIESILRVQDFSLQSELNFVEDFYYQHYIRKKNPSTPNLSAITHNPIAESFKPGQVPRMRTVTKELLDGVLGRVVGSTCKGPKPSLSLLPTDDELDTILQDLNARIIENPYPNDGVQYEDPLLCKQQLRSIVTQTEGLRDVNKRINISVENAMILVLEVEDYDLLLTGFTREDSSPKKAEIIQKRIQSTNGIFSFLRLVMAPVVKEDYDLSICNPYCYPEDEFFVRLLNSKKGGKFLKRIFPLLFPAQIFELSVVTIRNLFAIVSSPTNEQEDTQLKEVFNFIISALNNVLSFTQVMVCFKDLFLVNASRLLTRRLIKTIKTKVGIVVFFSFLMRARDSVDQLHSLMQQGQQEAKDIYASWTAFFKVVFSRLAGNLVSLLTSSLSNEYSNFPNSVQIWDFIIALAYCSNHEQKGHIYNELAYVNLCLDYILSLTFQ